jgi:tetratricopeptide (TPR) repeat protein
MAEHIKKTLVLSIYFALALSTLTVFWHVRDFDFVGYDDNAYVFENQHVLHGLTFDGIIRAFTSYDASNWHPLTWLSLMLDIQLFGPNPGWMHFVNLLLHIANTLLLFAVLKKMTGSLWPSAFAAAAFALHPMHVESVAWIAERKDVLSTFFLLLTLIAYVGYVKRRGIVRYLLALLLFSFGLMAKPMLVTLPFILVLLDYWPLERFSASITKQSKLKILYQLIIEKIPFFALAAASSVVTFFAQRAGGSVVDIKMLALGDRVGNAFLSYFRYIGKMVWPKNMAAFYPFIENPNLFWQAAICILALAAISILVIRFARNRGYLPVGWFWFIGTLVPVIGFVQVGGQAFADRYTYIPYIGLFIMIAWGVSELLSKWRYQKLALGIAAAIVLTAFGICSRIQVNYWKNNEALFSHAINVTQNNYIAQSNLAVTYSDLGRWQDAIECYKQAVRVKPNYPDAQYNLGIAYGNLMRYQEAIEAFKQAIRIRPDFADAYNNLGVAYTALGRYHEAAEAYEHVIKIKPDYVEAYYNLSNSCISLGRYPEAADALRNAIRIKADNANTYYRLGTIYDSLSSWQDSVESYRQAIKIDPNYIEAYNNLGCAYDKLGRYQDAVETYKQAVEIKPDFVEAYCNLGSVYDKLGRYQDEIEACQQAIRIKPDYANAHNNLGTAYFNLGRYQDAIESYKQAIKIKPDFAEAHYNLGEAYLSAAGKDSAVEEYKILKTLNTELADKLSALINK